MAVTDKEFEHIIKYVQDTLMVHSQIPVENIVDIAQLVNYDSWKSTKTRAKKVVEIDPMFQKFWDMYPPSNKFEYRGKEFIPDYKRALRSDFQVCQNTFNALIKKTKISAEEYIKALQVDVISRKQKSVKRGTNELDHMPGILVWLRNEKWYSAHIGEELPSEVTGTIYTEA